MISYDKDKVREQLSTDNVFELLNEWGGEPEYNHSGIISSTICHNRPGEGSRKLYYYEANSRFYCYTGCDNPSFDIFELFIKVASIQYNQDYNLNDAIRWVAKYFGLSGEELEDEDNEKLDDWAILDEYSRIDKIKAPQENEFVLKEYDSGIIDRMNYKVRIGDWLKEGIHQRVMETYQIGYFPGGEQISIPHFDKDNRFIGLRGRSLVQYEANKYGKYRPIRVGGVTYSHPLGMNLYGLNMNKERIRDIKKAIVFESEKSVLKYASAFGNENNISVAVCGSHLSPYQFKLLIDLGVQEIIIAFDRQFQKIGDKEWEKTKKNLIKIAERNRKDCIMSVIFDTEMITEYKASPIDESPEKFIELFKKRILV